MSLPWLFFRYAQALPVHPPPPRQLCRTGPAENTMEINVTTKGLRSPGTLLRQARLASQLRQNPLQVQWWPLATAAVVQVGQMLKVLALMIGAGEAEAEAGTGVVDIVGRRKLCLQRVAERRITRRPRRSLQQVQPQLLSHPRRVLQVTVRRKFLSRSTTSRRRLRQRHPRWCLRPLLWLLFLFGCKAG